MILNENIDKVKEEKNIIQRWEDSWLMIFSFLKFKLRIFFVILQFTTARFRKAFPLLLPFHFYAQLTVQVTWTKLN